MYRANRHYDLYGAAVIAVEGIDNVGKSTLVTGLAPRLESLGYLVTVVNEFGADVVGQTVRRMVRARWSEVPEEAQPLLIAADRYPRYLRAFSKLGNPRRIILCDRYLHSAIIYQAVSSRVLPHEMLEIVRPLYRDCFRQPDLTLLLDATVETATQRGGTNIHDREFLTSCFTYLRDFSLGETKVFIDAEADLMKVLQDCEAAVLRDVPSITKRTVPSSALDYCRSRYSGEVLFALCQGKEVLLQRKHWYPPDVHRIAGGGMERNEDPIAALTRELYEETGLPLESLNYRFVTSLVYNDHVDEDSFVSYLFEIDITNEERIKAGPTPDEGFEGWQAFSEEQLRQMVSMLNTNIDGKADWGAFRATALEAYLAFKTRHHHA